MSNLLIQSSPRTAEALAIDDFFITTELPNPVRNIGISSSTFRLSQSSKIFEQPAQIFQHSAKSKSTKKWVRTWGERRNTLNQNIMEWRESSRRRRIVKLIILMRRFRNWRYFPPEIISGVGKYLPRWHHSVSTARFRQFSGEFWDLGFFFPFGGDLQSFLCEKFSQGGNFEVFRL